uniref:Uncharacterized protein n=1 Tax=Anguilla anguilla TaxID=7936 RepID=A0A0E9UZD1_ANGAN
MATRGLYKGVNNKSKKNQTNVQQMRPNVSESFSFYLFPVTHS